MQDHNRLINDTKFPHKGLAMSLRSLATGILLTQTSMAEKPYSCKGVDAVYLRKDTTVYLLDNKPPAGQGNKKECWVKWRTKDGEEKKEKKYKMYLCTVPWEKGMNGFLCPE